ncbi:MAG TPA: polysaccharide deacetylase family protein [Gemmatirosa sp.]
MSITPLSLHPGLPGLNRPGFVFTGAHLVTSAGGVKNSLAPSRLDQVLGEARAAGWSVNLREANPRKLILTFDDGRRIDDEFAAVLDAHDATAIFFVCTASQLSCYTDAAPYTELTEANRQYLLERHVIGGHTHAHTHLGRLPAAQQAAVVGEGAQRFREWFGFAPRCFSYPWGAYRGATLRALRATGVRYAFLGRAGRLPTHDYLIPRVFLDTGDWDGGLDFVHRKRAEAVSNGKLLLRHVHAGLHLAAGAVA